MLTVSSGGRSRSKSPGGRRERSRSRAESPPKPAKPSKSKKYYEPSSDSEAVTETDSEEEDERRRRRRKDSERGPDRDDKRGSAGAGRRDERKYSRGKDETESESEEEADRRRRGGGKNDARRDSELDARRRRDSEYDAHGRRRDSEYSDGRHPSYAEAGRYEYAKVPAPVPTRHMSYSSGGGDKYDMPGSFREQDDRDPRVAGATRHMSYVDVEPGRGSGRDRDISGRDGRDRDGRSTKYVAAPAAGPQYAAAPRYEYAQPSHNIKYLPKAEPRSGKEYAVEDKKPARRDSEDKYGRRRDSERDKYKGRRDDDDSDDDSDKKGKHRGSRKDASDDERDRKGKHRSRKDDSDDDRRKPSRRDSDYKHRDGAQVLEIRPGAGGGPAGGHRLSAAGLAPGMLSLAAPGGHQMLVGGLPPGSPLLEAYRGTYQSISPMPSPMALPADADDGMSDLEPLEGDYSSDDSQHARGKRSALVRHKRVEIYDPEPDALAIAAELKHQKPSTKPLIKILPQLSDDNMMALRAEYKKHFKVNGKGINVAKHIKLKLTGNAGKAAYATALGRWESEAHWANFWYQSGSSRRELLIESLIGRSNAEIRKIKEAFQDKRYSDSLEKCMQTELKKDKFRNAVLLALQEKRQDELAPLSKALIAEDVRDLHKALVAKDGGESAMIEVIVVRSGLHLRQVLLEFEAKYKRNFAREMIQKSQNLVGETLAHILNGVLNRPVRDAMLLHQALAETSKDRAELLISRLVRYHWEPKHLLRIKAAYRQKYGSRVEDDIEAGTKGEFAEFCLSLCEGATK